MCRSTVRTLMDSAQGYDDTVWRQMANELGLHGIAVSERWGGAGAGMPELAVVFEEMGAALLCSPFFATVSLPVWAYTGAAPKTRTSARPHRSIACRKRLRGSRAPRSVKRSWM